MGKVVKRALRGGSFRDKDDIHRLFDSRLEKPERFPHTPFDLISHNGSFIYLFTDGDSESRVGESIIAIRKDEVFCVELRPTLLYPEDVLPFRDSCVSWKGEAHYHTLVIRDVDTICSVPFVALRQQCDVAPSFVGRLGQHDHHGLTFAHGSHEWSVGFCYLVGTYVSFLEISE
jgi:hypothetical protein